MPAIPPRIRVPIEYGVAMALSLATAWVYATYAMADFLLALALGLSFVLGFWVLLQISPKTRGKGIHLWTVAALAATLYAVLRLAGAV